MDSDIERKVDKLIQKKKPRFRKFMIAFGAFIIPFVLISSLVLPIYNDRRGIDILLSYFGGEDNNIVAEEPESEPEAYNYWYAPENSFGMQEMKTVNWSYFKSLFLAHTDWILEYKRYEYSDWTDGSDYLTIERTWNDTGFWKFALVFNVPVHVFSARFTFGIDLECLQYVERDGYEVWINYSANATETYSCMFNWSDIASIPNLIITKGIQNDMFWFRFRRDDIPPGYYEFDPTFGYEGEKGEGEGIENVIEGIYATPTDGDGTADNIQVYLTVTTAAHNVKCALYNNDKTGPITNGVTEEKSIGVGGPAWQTFNFEGTKPTITNNVEYIIVVWANAASGNIHTHFGAETGEKYHVSDHSYNGFPSPLGGADFDNFVISIFCTYTEAAGETWQDVNITVNGAFTNITIWYNVDTTYNGAFTNTTVWQNVNTSINGAFTNATTWQNVNTTVNGEFTNTSTKTWQNVNDTVNGVFTNTTAWQNVNTTINGVFTNATVWYNVNTSINGAFTNATVWYNVDTTYNGEFTNTTTWRNVNTTINGAFTNTTIWQVVNGTVNGAFTNTSTATWQVVNNTVNGAFTNTTIWYNVDVAYNGVFTNTTTWHNVNVSINGAFTNATTWQDVDTTYNGAFTNATTWQDVDTTFNGEFTNVSIRTWQVVNNTINGVFTNTTLWYNVDISINGAFTNGTTWQNVDVSINGVFTNTSLANITITDEYPANGSTDVAVNTSIYFTVTHTLGYLMNITVYTGSNLTNCSALLGSFNSVTNGTYYLGYHNASELNTEYAWRVNVTDAYDNYAEGIYNFTTTSIPIRGPIFTLRGYSMGMVIAFACMFGILFFVMGVKWKRKQRYKKEYDEQRTRWE